ncbi:MAG: substrate-binding domain-containing protein [Chloroflexi bacterium]|nr:substrate-binding domain-containing protein [Chloroflexota bacterium]
MLPEQREGIILNLLEQYGTITISQICSNCNCSARTARRDLLRLENKGLLKRLHGGAVSVEPAKADSTLKVDINSLMEARTALVDRADALIVTPSDTVTTRRLTERAYRAGVPVIAESHNYQNVTTVVSIDNYAAGLALGRWVTDYVQRHLDGKVIALSLGFPLDNTDARSRGFSDGIRHLAPGNRVIYHVNAVLFQEAQRVTADALAAHPEINVIFGVNDSAALGALEAYRQAGLDEDRLVVVSVGLEGPTTKSLLEEGGAFKASAAMFPEIVAQVCVDAAICAYDGWPLPKRLITPFAVITAENLDYYYHQDKGSKEWNINWARASLLLQNTPALIRIHQFQRPPKLKNIVYVEIFSSHEWYQSIQKSMQSYTRSLKIYLEIVDASYDMTREVAILKRTIGHTAAHFVNEGDTIILDSGVTTAYLASALRGKENITVITNSQSVLETLAKEKGITLISSGGLMRHESQSFVGPGAEAAFRDLRADKAFISATGISFDFGLSNTNMEEAAVKQAMINAAKEVILLADYSKIGVESLIKIAPLEKVHTLITDPGVSAHDHAALAQRGINVIIAESHSWQLEKIPTSRHKPLTEPIT